MTDAREDFEADTRAQFRKHAYHWHSCPKCEGRGKVVVGTVDVHHSEIVCPKCEGGGILWRKKRNRR